MNKDEAYQCLLRIDSYIFIHADQYWSDKKMKEYVDHRNNGGDEPTSVSGDVKWSGDKFFNFLRDCYHRKFGQEAIKLQG